MPDGNGARCPSSGLTKCNRLQFIGEASLSCSEVYGVSEVVRVDCPYAAVAQVSGTEPSRRGRNDYQAHGKPLPNRWRSGTTCFGAHQGDWLAGR
jgi:hypothetical protein